jgi:alkanesulfonate monooxygenase SsuD/methylene tetrahydromethanopterin reductase-like flavin-dependent oxidoreductase (luciferase family)
MPVGVITHLHNVGFDELRSLARAAEAAGADWLGIPDAFWWRDTWVLVAEAARVTSRLELGPMVTNPYMRHPFHTVAAVATLQDLAGERIFVGVAAGGSEVSGVARISRSDAPKRVRALAALLRAVAAGQPFDRPSGRTLEVALRPPPVLIAGRGDGLLDATGRAADRALLWAVPSSDLDRSVGVIERGARAGRETTGKRPELVWAPLVDHGGPSRERVRTIAAYSVLNSRAELHARWGLDHASIDELRRRLVGGGAAAAAALVPAAALDDLVLADPEPAKVGAVAHRIGATSLALPAFSIAELPERIAWARQVLAMTR